MNSADCSFFRRNIEFTMKNFSRSTLVGVNNARCFVNVEPFSEILEFKFVTRKRITNRQKTHDIGVMISSNVPKVSRVANIQARISIVQSDGQLNFCSKITHNHLIDKHEIGQLWKSIINVDNILEAESKFLNKKMLKIHIGLQMMSTKSKNTQKKHHSIASYESLVDNPQFSDIKIICSDGKTIHAHKCILMAFGNDGAKDSKPSHFFRSMIENQTKMSQEGHTKVTDIEFNVMYEVIRYVYTGKVYNIHLRPKEFLSVADMYEIVGLKEICIEFLTKQLTVENVLEILELMYLLKIDKLRENCIDFVKFNFEAISTRNDYKKLSSEILHDIIKSMSKDSLKRKFLHDLTKVVRFKNPLAVLEPSVEPRNQQPLPMIKRERNWQNLENQIHHNCVENN